MTKQRKTLTQRPLKQKVINTPNKIASKDPSKYTNTQQLPTLKQNRHYLDAEEVKYSEAALDQFFVWPTNRPTQRESAKDIKTCTVAILKDCFNGWKKVESTLRSSELTN